MDEELVVLVDARDTPVGAAPKLRAHREGLLHRAISVFVFDRTGRMLLQRRSDDKYHSAGLWTNAACTHPRPGEEPHAAALRRLEEEMGLGCPLAYSFSFLYRAELEGGLVEHELDHVFVGTVATDPHPDEAEVGEWRWVEMDDLEDEIARNPEVFTAWFPIALHHLRPRLRGRSEAGH